MNSIWNKNCSLFKERFPQLSESLAAEISESVKTEKARNGSLTAQENGLMLHSKYNPEKEGESAASSFDPEKSDAAVFLGFGLGYAALSFAQKFPEASLILIEHDAPHFFSALNAVDWTPVFSHKKLILAIGAPLERIADILGSFPPEKLHIFKNKAHTAHDEDYFNAAEQIIIKNKSKEEVNANTLEKFARLWLSNSCRNLDRMKTLDGIARYARLGTEIPFVILAAGPSLETILPHLAEIKKRSVLVCVDTALHCCLRQNVEPDFIILSDPQYACSLHLEFLQSPSSVLITEIAAYPSVFRFCCRETVLFSSLFPIGQFFESQTEEKGKLAAGGSVATSAWDFARFCGAREIFIAGMDLGFPGKQTHIKGSQFEEKAHRESMRLKPAETECIHPLFHAGPFYARDYNGNTILTDKKMSLFSWWFETNCLRAEAEGIKTASLTSQSLAINGIEKYSLADFLLKPEIQQQKESFFARSQETKKNKDELQKKFDKAKISFANGLDSLESLAKKGISLCSKAIQSTVHLPEICRKLDELDILISRSSGKEAAALVFPTQRQLAALSKKIEPHSEFEKKLYPVQYSMLVYTELLKSIRQYRKFF